MKNNIREIRKKREIKVDIMARLTGIKAAKLYYLETEGAIPSLMHAYLLASFFDLDVEDIWPNEVIVMAEPAVTYVRRRPLHQVAQP